MPKLPLWMKCALWFFGATGFFTFALAALSMFLWAGVPLTPLCSENSHVSLMITGGTVNVLGYADAPLGRNPYFLEKAFEFPSLSDRSLYLYRSGDFEVLPSSQDGDAGWYMEIPLVSIAIALLLVFLFLVRAAAKMRQKAIFTAPLPNQEPS